MKKRLSNYFLSNLLTLSVPDAVDPRDVSYLLTYISIYIYIDSLFYLFFLNKTITYNNPKQFRDDKQRKYF